MLNQVSHANNALPVTSHNRANTSVSPLSHMAKLATLLSVASLAQCVAGAEEIRRTNSQIDLNQLSNTTFAGGVNSGRELTNDSNFIEARERANDNINPDSVSLLTLLLSLGAGIFVAACGVGALIYYCHTRSPATENQEPTA